MTSFIKVLGISLMIASPLAAQTPCTTPTPACIDWVPIGGGPGRALVYGSHSLDKRNERITRAFILIHGASRNADDYFRSALAAAFLAGALDNTIVLAPRFASSGAGSCRDTLAQNEISWVDCGGDVSWRAGGTGTTNKNVTSFDLIDEILRKLARKQTFPNLKAIVVAGHSAGGQYVNRYEMANQVHDQLGVPVSYIVANPSSYAYPDSLRPRISAYASEYPALPPGYTVPPSATPGAAFGRFGDSDDCTTYNDWPYGFRNRTGYTAKMSDDLLKKQLAARPTTYIVGELDVLPLYGFDSSCPAMAQGPTRLARGIAFGKFVNEKYGAKHRTMVVPACGHNARCMFVDDSVSALIFGDDRRR
jgi:pimeloyl-ACP methyl ester carboxylesterase